MKEQIMVDENAGKSLNAGDYIGKKENVSIRVVMVDDAPLLCNWWNDGKVMEHAGYPNGLNTNTNKILEQIGNEKDNHRRLIIEIDSNRVGEMCFQITNSVAEIGIKICDFSYQEKGYGTKAIKLLVEYLFRERKVQAIKLDTNRNNRRAQHVYEKIGFIKIKENIDAWQDQIGVMQSSVEYELLREDYYRQENRL
jgi:RimJ/RimL family protein N-acetyltransferase